MEKNKFEKQVKQQMDELAIQPADAVWKKIEARIEKKKSRKWGLIILFLLIGITLAGAYWLWNTRQQELLAGNNSVKTNLKKDNSNLLLSQKEAVLPKNNSVKISVNKKNDDEIIMKEKENEKQSQLLNNKKVNQKINLNAKDYATVAKKKKVAGKTYVNTSPAAIAEETLPNSTLNDNISSEPKDSTDKKINNDSLAKIVTAKTIAKDKDTSVQKQTPGKKIKQTNKYKWKFGVLADGGISGVGNNLFKLNNLSAYNNSSPGSVTGQPASYFSSAGKSGFGFVAGVLAEKNISKKTKLIIGVNYKSFSTSVKLNDSSGIYRATSSADKYVNHFNFIEAPVSLQIQLGKGKHTPLLWQSGITISELISSDALQLNYAIGYYYKNNSLFNKIQLGFNTSLLVSLFSKHQHPLLLGPYFYYGASQIANEGLYSKKHFVFTGFHTAVSF